MVTKSKKHDLRFWGIWRSSGAVGTIKDAYRRKFPMWDRFQTILSNVRAGYLGSETAAREMIREHGLPVAQLEAALEEGRALKRSKN